MLRERLHVAGKAGDLVYDRKLYNAIRHFQQHADLTPTGIIDNKTLAAINGPKPSATSRSTPSSPTWNAGAGCRATSARLM